MVCSIGYIQVIRETAMVDCPLPALMSGYHNWLVVEPYPSEKYESQWEGLSHILWKNKIHVPNHQPVQGLMVLIKPPSSLSLTRFHAFSP